MKKVHVEVTVDLIVEVDEGVDVNEVLTDMEYHFESRTPGADITDEICAVWEIDDSP